MGTDETLAALNGLQLLMGLAHCVYPPENPAIQSISPCSLYYPNRAPESASAVKPECPTPLQTLAGSSMLQGSLNLMSSTLNMERPCLLHLAFKGKILKEKLPRDSIHQLEEHSSIGHQCSPAASKSNTIPSDVRIVKFYGFFKNPVTATNWLRSEFLNSQAFLQIKIVSGVASRYDLGLISRSEITCLELICSQRNLFWLMKPYALSSSFEKRTIRPISFSRIGDWIPVLKPVLLSSMLLVSTKRAICDHVMVVGVKKVYVMSVSLHSSTVRCPVDWGVFVELSVVVCVLAKASDKVYFFPHSFSFSDSNFGSLIILEEFANKLCNSFASIMFLMLLNLCLCILVVDDVISIVSVSDSNNFPLWECNRVI